MIAVFFGGQLSIFRRVEFDTIEFVFEDDRKVTITQKPIQKDDSGHVARSTPSYIVNYASDSKELEWDPDEIWNQNRPDITVVRRSISPMVIER
jgi:hypothetical protein